MSLGHLVEGCREDPERRCRQPRLDFFPAARIRKPQRHRLRVARQQYCSATVTYWNSGESGPISGERWSSFPIVQPSSRTPFKGRCDKDAAVLNVTIGG